MRGVVVGEGDDGFPEAGAVEVDFDWGVLGSGPAADGLGGGEGEDGAVEGVFEGEEGGGCAVDVEGLVGGWEDGVGLHVGESEVVGVARDDLDGEGAGQGGDAAGLPLVDVGAGVGEDGVWGLGHVRADGELVAHGAGEDEEGGGVAGQGGDVGFEGGGGGVFGEDVVEEGAMLDGGEHGGGGGRDDVACVVVSWRG